MGFNSGFKGLKHLISMGKEDTEVNIWPSKRKWRAKEPHSSTIDGYVLRTRYYLRN
jgi:hypothetical protein